ncbi:MAG TPA: SsrA-binding protein, partial [Casimicrobiaceae bacterium]|nr:SsrA-binding protein [Casimicrobiaceae bacterium]
MSIVENRKAFHDYFIEERFEAGIALEGWEVKAIRGGRANLKEAYVVVKNAELMLIGAHIASGISLMYIGDLKGANEHCDKAATYYDRNLRPVYHTMYRM